jgi:hypothetical protein
LVVRGGAGFASDVKIGRSLEVNGASVMHGSFDVSGPSNFSGISTITNTTNSVSTSTGALVVRGGAGFASDVKIGGSLEVNGSLITHGEVIGNNTYAGILAVVNTTQSTSTSTGALTVLGGAGIAGNLNVGSDVDIAGALTVHGLSIQNGIFVSPTAACMLYGTFTSNSPGTGALAVVGGVGVGENLNVGGNMAVSGDITNKSISQTVTASGPWIGTTTVGLFFWKYDNLVFVSMSIVPGSNNSSASPIYMPINSIPVGYRPSSTRYAQIILTKTGTPGAMVAGLVTIDPSYAITITMANSTYSTNGNVPDNTWGVPFQTFSYVGW